MNKTTSNMTVSEIYEFIGKSVSESISEDWSQANIHIEIADGYCSYTGDFETNDERRLDIDVFEFPDSFADYLELLYKITTEGGNNRWNRAAFKLFPDGKFDMEFSWDEELHNEISGNK